MDKELLTIDMPKNVEKRFLIKVRKDVIETSLNLRFYNSLALKKYVVIFVPTIRQINFPQTEEIFYTP